MKALLCVAVLFLGCSSGRVTAAISGDLTASTTTTTSTSTTTSTPPTQASPTLFELVEKHFDPADHDWALRVAACESSADAKETFSTAVNTSSGSSGWFQHLPRFWDERSAAAGVPGVSILDPEANVTVAAWLLYETPQAEGHWYPSESCWRR